MKTTTTKKKNTQLRKIAFRGFFGTAKLGSVDSFWANEVHEWPVLPSRLELGGLDPLGKPRRWNSSSKVQAHNLPEGTTVVEARFPVFCFGTWEKWAYWDMKGSRWLILTVSIGLLLKSCCFCSSILVANRYLMMFGCKRQMIEDSPSLWRSWSLCVPSRRLVHICFIHTRHFCILLWTLVKNKSATKLSNPLDPYHVTWWPDRVWTSTRRCCCQSALSVDSPAKGMRKWGICAWRGRSTWQEKLGSEDSCLPFQGLSLLKYFCPIWIPFGVSSINRMTFSNKLMLLRQVGRFCQFDFHLSWGLPGSWSSRKCPLQKGWKISNLRTRRHGKNKARDLPQSSNESKK